MDKVLVEVYLPAAGRSYDVYIPLASPMNEVLQLISTLLSDLSEGSFMANDDTVLCDAESGTIFNINIQLLSWALRTAQNWYCINTNMKGEITWKIRVTPEELGTASQKLAEMSNNYSEINKQLLQEASNIGLLRKEQIIKLLFSKSLECVIHFKWQKS